MSLLNKSSWLKHASLDNGISVLVEEMEWVSSASISILVPTGAVAEPETEQGISGILCDMMDKGAGAWDSKQLSQQFENLGIKHGQGAGLVTTVFSAAMLGENIEQAISLLATVLRSPRLPAKELDSVKALALQQLALLEDQPSSKVMEELRRHFYPGVYGRSTLGTKEGIQNITPQSLEKFYKERLLPEGIIIGVAGKVVAEEVISAVEKYFGDWKGGSSFPTPDKLSEEDQTFHLKKDSSQVQIALAYPSVDYKHPDYYAARLAVSLLSGGMFGRLFIEVREKRGLVYSVSAQHSAALGRAAVMVYAGTTPENAQNCLDVILNELRGLASGVSEEELKRAKADLKSKIVMSSEISSARSSALVSDWWNLGLVRSLDEVKENIAKVTCDEIVQHVSNYKVEPLTLATLGKQSVELNK